MSDASTEPTPKTGDLNELPEWGRAALSDANNQAAERRIKIRELTEENTRLLNQIQEFTDAKTAAETAVAAKDNELLKLNVALSAGVPGEQAAEFAELLQGSTEQELKDYADKIRKFSPANQRAVDHSQGRGSEDNAPLSPEAEFEALLKRQGLFS